MTPHTVPRCMRLVCVVLCAMAAWWMIVPVAAWAGEGENGGAKPFEYAWEVLFREEAIGYSLSRFCFISEGDEQRLRADGYRSFVFEIGPVSLRITEQTRAVWDDRGRILELEARTAVGGDTTLTHVLRTTEGMSIVKETDRREKEYFFVHDEYDYTELDRFLHTIDDPDEKTTFRILSITEEKVKKISYEFLGVCDNEVNGQDIACSRIGFDGPKSIGEMQVDGLGIPVFFSMDTPLGSFTFVPCDPALAEETLFFEGVDFFDVP